MEFKKGDKVKIPKRKSAVNSASIEEFMRELKNLNYKCDYLLVDDILPTSILLVRDNGAFLGCCRFTESDLELYEEKYAIDYIKKNKIVVRLTTAEQWNNLKKLDTTITTSFYGDGYYQMNAAAWVDYSNRDYYTKEGYKMIDYSQIKFLDMKEQFKGVEGRKLIGYKCPYDLFGGNVKKGILYVNKPGIIANNGTPSKGYYPENSTNLTDYLPAEIVKTWEPVYEEDFKVGDWFTCKKGNPYKAIRESTVRITKIDNGIWCMDKDGTPSRLANDEFEEVYRKATLEEIEAVSSVVINGHKAERKNGGIEFGCQRFEFTDLVSIQKLFHREVNAKITIHGVEITNEIITKLLQL